MINSKIIKAFCSLILFFSVSTALHAQASIKDKRIPVVYDNIYKYFFDSTKNLFVEKTEVKKEEKEFSYLWPLCALIQTANEMEAIQPGKNYMAPVLSVIDKYYNPGKPPHAGYDSYLVAQGGDGRFYDDNQWVGIACIDAYQRNKDKKYLAIAKDIYDFMLTGYDTISGGGLYWKEGDLTTKNTCSNGPGVVLGLQLYKSTKEKKYLDTAILLYNWTNKTLQSPEGIYYDNIRLPSMKVDKRVYTYNAGTMLQSAVLLYSITGKKSYLEEAQNIAAKSLQHFYRNGLFPSHYWFNAVLLRGYAALYNADRNRQYIDAFKNYADKIWTSQKDSDSLIGEEKIKALIDQAAYAEILAKLEQVK